MEIGGSSSWGEQAGEAGQQDPGGCSLAVFGPRQGEELATGQAPCQHLFLSSNEN